jgi:hypothetical protein
MVGLELCKLVPGRLPLLAGSDLVLGHLHYLLLPSVARPARTGIGQTLSVRE